jgi:uncharacterized protein
MKIDIAKLLPEGSSFVGELPGEILGLENDRFAHAVGPISYDVFAYLAAQELIVKGVFHAPVELLCGRCAGFFSTTLTISSFLRAYPISDTTESVDLTEDIREDILVEIPAYPKCAYEGSGVCPFSGVDLDELKLDEPPPLTDPWGDLDKLER